MYWCNFCFQCNNVKHLNRFYFSRWRRLINKDDVTRKSQKSSAHLDVAKWFTAEQVHNQISATFTVGSDDKAVGKQNIYFEDDENENVLRLMCGKVQVPNLSQMLNVPECEWWWWGTSRSKRPTQFQQITRYALFDSILNVIKISGQLYTTEKTQSCYILGH